jgi:hypothetical protein
MEDLPYVKIPLHTIIKVTMEEDGLNSLEFINVGVECVDTYRAKPSNCKVDRPLEEAIASVPTHMNG